MNPFDTPTRLGFAGDWHANTRYARAVVRHAADQGVSHILHTGDFGWLFRESFIEDLEQTLDKLGVHVLFVDGNHEDHDYLDALVDPQITPHIRHLRRGTRWEWDGIRFVALGGAHSVDRPNRRPGISWWPQETIGFQDLEKVAEGGEVDVMLTHDCPAGVSIPGIEGNPFGFHPMELAMSDEHRQVLRTAVDTVRPKLLVHGHYHQKYREVLRADYPCQILGLDCDGVAIHENFVTMELSELKQLVGQP